MVVNSLVRNQFLGAVLLVSLLTSCGKGEDPAAAGAPPPLPVKLQTIQSGQVEDSSEFVGTLEAQERVTLQPQIQGRIDRIYVSSGDRVQPGTLIASLSIDQTEADVASAAATVNSARAAQNTAQAQLESAIADRTKAQADVDLQRIQIQRTQQLVAQGAEAQQELDIGRRDLQQAIATFQAADKQVNAQRAAVSQSVAGVREAEANTASASVNLNFKQVVSPISGLVGDFQVKTGDYVTVGQDLTSIIKNDAFDMRIAVPTNESIHMQTGLPVQLIDPNTGKAIGSGSVNFISPQTNTSAQSILLKARFLNRNDRLRDGQYVRAKIIWSRSPGILIPTTAVTRIGGQSFVFVAENDTSQEQPRQIVHQRPVKLGDIQGESYQVIEGIKTGESIAVSNILKLQDGAPIQPAS